MGGRGRFLSFLIEREDMARRRGEKMTEILTGLGAPEDSIKLEVIDAVADGLSP